jgi:hypothetical protein
MSLLIHICVLSFMLKYEQRFSIETFRSVPDKKNEKERPFKLLKRFAISRYHKNLRTYFALTSPDLAPDPDLTITMEKVIYFFKS